MKLKRYSKNPILKPTKNWWENSSVFNAGVVMDKGKVKILYRAIGEDNISRFGYAESLDGFLITKRLPLPAYESNIQNPYERIGCEDPRITKIDDTFYITYCASSLYPAIAPKPKGIIGAPFRCRIAMLSTEDFKTFKHYGVVLSKLDDKNAVLFPEKIGGNYVMLHRIFPDIWIAYSKDLRHWTGHEKIMSRKEPWEFSKIGAGSPPIKTQKGWLEFYHAADKDNVYRLGIVVFALDDPEKIIYRSKEPILEPEMPYEKRGIVSYAPKVVFTCGAVEKNNEYLVYYGASDRYLCVAMIDKKEVLKEIK